MPTVSERWKKFEELGEEKVRQQPAHESIGANHERAAREWLSYKERLRESSDSERNSASNLEQLRIARSAKNAAWTAAIAATIAAICAAISIYITLFKMP